eukprot:TRINITY_DN36687_c0_g1_i1.p1 TRINITY_DN36687_c0_g1~~TRINITY_DN36687_c0_g1_i1.p1  ORF type:complete len:351 (-),score=41.81 TRINITY_DN36687_c0_g1_i1:19-1071(-)
MLSRTLFSFGDRGRLFVYMGIGASLASFVCWLQQRRQARTIPIKAVGDAEVQAFDPLHVVEIMHEAVRLHGLCLLHSPARVSVELPCGKLCFTTGGTSSVIGFRVYDLHHVDKVEDRGELTAVLNSQSGHMLGVVSGRSLGIARTAAIGAVAIRTLSRVGSTVLGILGTGSQALAALKMALVVRRFSQVKVWNRTQNERLSRFAAAASELCRCANCRLVIVADIEDAVQGSDVIITATSSPTSLLKAEWLVPGMHINYVGPKFKQAHEISPNVVSRCDLRVTDSLAQCHAFGDEFVLHNTPAENGLCELGQILVGKQRGRSSSEDVSIFFSVGLSGTEVTLAQSLLQASR